MKILGGFLKGRNYYMPAGIRPTQQIVRKSLFDSLGHDLKGESFLELFAGSGAVGLEAVSYGVDHCLWVEKDPKCAQVIEENISHLKLDGYDELNGYYQLMNADSFAVIKALAAQKKRFSIIFMDPPYGRQLAKKALKLLNEYDILQPNYIVVAEHEKGEILPESLGRFLCFRQKRFGRKMLSFYHEST